MKTKRRAGRTPRNRPSQRIGKRIQNARGFFDKRRAAEEHVRLENPQPNDPIVLSRLIDAARSHCHKKMLDAVSAELTTDTHDVRYLQWILCDNAEHYYYLLLQRPLLDEYHEKLKDIYDSAVQIRNIMRTNTVIMNALDAIAWRDMRWCLHSSAGYLIPQKPRSRDELAALNPVTQALHALERLAVWARRAGRRAKPRGRPAEYALNHLVFLLSQFWRYYLRRRVAPRSENRGSLRDFVSLIMRHIDPYVTQKQIGSALKKVKPTKGG